MAPELYRPAPTDVLRGARPLLAGVALVVVTLVVSQGVISMPSNYLFGAIFALAIFIFVFIRSEAGLYLTLLSMLLSPRFAIGGGGLAESRSVEVRIEDVLLVVIALSWFAKTAVNKELGLVLRTQLNRPIFSYIAVSAIATLLGTVFGSVGAVSGFFYVVKYVEYFVVYYLTVNNLRDRSQAWRLITVAFVTAAIVSLIGVAQVPSGQRVSAPFEGQYGEPNTFGGYLLLMISIALGLALETSRLRMRAAMLGLLAIMGLPFAFTLSRASYLGFVPAMVVLAVLSRRRRVMVALLVVALLTSPVLFTLLPQTVAERIMYTFEPEKGQPTVRIGHVGLDPSTTARLLSIKAAFEGWLRRPVLGWGVTGFGFMDSQYARLLVETGVIGFGVFLWLIRSLVASTLSAVRSVRDPDDRGLAIGFLAGTVGLLFHAVGANTFIIVRIMEPFWFFTGVVLTLPLLERREEAVAA